ncbi:MAG TPA: chemotaxis protein CheB, partial [Thermoanaerobaculia bacterium]
MLRVIGGSCQRSPVGNTTTVVQKPRTRKKRARPAARPTRTRAASAKRRTRADSSDTFPIIGVGASAGGLEAFESLLKHLPTDTGMAFVLVQHLDPKRDSMLKEILSRSTRMPVQEVRRGMRVEGDHVYVVPAGADIGLSDGTFRVQPRAEERGHELPIDHFLRSLAEQYKSRAVGVVLSGTLSDGALGLRAIKAEGGMTFAQDEASAKFRDMPRAAIAAGAVDFILPPEKIAQEIARMAKHPYVRPPAAATPEPATADGPDHRRLLKLVQSATGVDFTNYRQSTVRRRIARRMALRKTDTLREYVDLVDQEPAEIHALHDDILITVTAFFRDPQVFDSLKATVFPSFRRDRGGHAPIRIWIPGCATGEEVYSLAIALFESLQDSQANPSIQIFGTDVSETAVDKARAGTYLDGAMVDVSKERLRRFFLKTDRGWQISKTVRDVCIFARQNVTADPPFSNLDLISCRNLLIYLEPVLQKRVLPLFHYALRPQGYLLLGNAESIAGYGDLFAPVDRENRIFAKRPGGLRQALDFGPRIQEPDKVSPLADNQRAPAVDLQKEADRLVIGRYGPASVLIGDNYEILQFRGRTSPYLEPAPGAASYNVLKMAREGLLVELRSSILKAKRGGRPVRKEGLHVRQDGTFRDVDLEVIPLRQDGPGFHHFLVLFEEAHRKAKSPSRASEPPRVDRRDEHETIVKLEQELTATKDYLQAIIEEQEASNEELKSANEEILSSNEELQSTNEELETSNEELQSLNEELHTVNGQLEYKTAELESI